MISIRSRLATGLLAGFVLLLGIGGTAVFFIIRRDLTSEFDLALQARAQAAANLLKAEDRRLEIEASEAAIADFTRGEHPDFFEIRSADGTFLRRSGAQTPARIDSHPPLSRVPTFWNTMLGQDRPARAVGFSFKVQTDEGESAATPEASVIFVRDRAPLDHTLHLLFIVLLGVGIMSLAGTVLVVGAAVRLGLRPLEEIAIEAESIDVNTLAHRFKTRRLPAELRPIAARLNDLLSRLEASFERERRFSGDVAHELRTPVSELRALAEVALKWPSPDPDIVHAFEDALQIARKMESIVSGLLFLVRCDSGRQSPRCEAIALQDFLADAWEPVAAEALRKELRAGFQVPPDAVVWCDRTALAVIFANLFSNAVSYSPLGSEITVAVQAAGKTASVFVTNQTTDLSPEDLPRLCERFWRKDPARHDAAHAGLGLSLALSCARLAGGTLEPEIDGAGRLTIKCALPSLRQPRSGAALHSTVAS